MEEVTIEEGPIEIDNPQWPDIYKIAKDNFEKAIYLLQKSTGIFITIAMAEELAENYAAFRAYTYIDATVYNIPWYLIYSFNGFFLHNMMVRKNTILRKYLLQLGFTLKDCENKRYVSVETDKGYVLIATDYKHNIDEKGKLREWLCFSIIQPDPAVKNTVLYLPVKRFTISVNSQIFADLINSKNWNPKQDLLDIAQKYMNL